MHRVGAKMMGIGLALWAPMLATTLVVAADEPILILPNPRTGDRYVDYTAEFGKHGHKKKGVPAAEPRDLEPLPQTPAIIVPAPAPAPGLGGQIILPPPPPNFGNDGADPLALPPPGGAADSPALPPPRREARTREDQFTPVLFGDLFQSTRLRLAAPVGGIATSPSQSGYVGRMKPAEGQSALPLSRVYFRYDYFDDARVSPNGVDVNRFLFGVEQAFREGRASVGIQFPFATTLDHKQNLTDGTYSQDVELGNIAVVGKIRVLRQGPIAITVGGQVEVPISEDLVIDSAGSRLVIENDSLAATPFVAGLLQGERAFLQGWAGVTFDINGSPVVVNGSQIGRFNDQQLLQADLQLGYWLRKRPENRGLTGLAPFVELHYNTPLSSGDSIATAFTVDENYDELNVGAGLQAHFGSSLATTVGAVIPLNSGDDQFFDYQAGLQAQWRYGARDRGR